MTEFFYMGGYAFFVWTAYSVTLVVLLVNFLWPVIQRRKFLRGIREAQIRQTQLARRRR